MTVADQMSEKVICVGPDENLQTARALMAEQEFRCLPVVERGHLVGIITDRDVRLHYERRERTTVGAIMTPNPRCITPEASMAEAARLLLVHKIGALPVVKQSELVGIITTSDILRTFVILAQDG